MSIREHCPKGGTCAVSAPETPGQCHFCWLATFDPDYGGVQPDGPGLVRKAINFAGAVMQHAVAGGRQASETEKARRLAICSDCSVYYDAERKSCKHVECGCDLGAKAGWQDQKCPIGRWGARRLPRRSEYAPRVEPKIVPVPSPGSIALFSHENLAAGQRGYRFNPSIVADGNGYVFAWRDGWAGSEVWIQRMNRYFDPIGTPSQLGLKHPACPFGREDPRLFRFRGQLHVMYTGVRGTNTFEGTSVFYAPLSDALEVERVYHPEQSETWEKNWGFFEWRDELYAVYSINPHKVVKIEGERVTVVAEESGVRWGGIGPHGGAAPVLHGGEFWNFCHDRVHRADLGYDQYRSCLYTFENAPPFRPKAWLPEPYALADPATKPDGQYCAVLFTGGVVRDGGRWVTSDGVHDRWCELREHDLRPIPIAGDWAEASSYAT